MTADLDVAGTTRTASSLGRLTGWKLWTVPRPARLVILGVELIATVGVLVSALDAHWAEWAVVRWLLIVGVSVLHAELSARVERLRRYLTAGVHVTMTSVWAFTAVLTLPTCYAATLVITLFAYSSWQRRSQRSTLPHREIYSAAVAVLAALAASGVHHAVSDWLPSLPGGGAGAIAAMLALIVYFGVNSVLVLTTIYLAVGPVPWQDLLPDREELALEIGTLVLGMFLAQALIATPWLLPMVILLLILLQRSSLVSQLEVAAATDTKTGLLNAAAWQELAQRELVRSQRTASPCALMLLDLDHFKRVNDTLGHLAGDAALRAIGDALKRELRGYDAVARFGGEEFVVFLNDLELDAAVPGGRTDLGPDPSLDIAGVDGRASGSRSPPRSDWPATRSTASTSPICWKRPMSRCTRPSAAGRDRVGLPPNTQVAAAHPA